MADQPKRLSRKTVAQLPDEVQLPAGGVPPGDNQVGIVHLGWGNFARAHIGTIINDLSPTDKAGWGISAVSMRSPTIRDQMEPQDNLYTVSEKHADGDITHVVDVVKESLVLGENPQRVIDRLAHPDTKMVTITVTQQGYVTGPEGGLDASNPMVAAELAGEAPVQSVPGLIARALEQRQKAGIPPFSVASLDNIPDNGHLTQRVVAEYADRISPALGQHVRNGVAFPNSMVDRITPRPTSTEVDRLAERIGIRDESAIFTEPYRQLVLEDKFGPLGRPKLETIDCVHLTDNPRPFEAAKIKMLNGTHMMMGSLGRQAGFRTVDGCMADEDMGKFAKRFMAEVAASMDPIPGVNLHSYAAALATRFDNPRMHDDVDRLANDTSKKINPRLLNALRDSMEKGTPNDAMTVAVAGWVRFMQGDGESGPQGEEQKIMGRTDDGRYFAINDPIAPAMQSLARNGSNPDLILKEAGLDFSDYGAAGQAARRKVISALQTMQQQDALSAVRGVTKQLDQLPDPVKATRAADPAPAPAAAKPAGHTATSGRKDRPGLGGAGQLIPRLA